MGWTGTWEGCLDDYKGEYRNPKRDVPTFQSVALCGARMEKQMLKGYNPMLSMHPIHALSCLKQASRRAWLKTHN